MRTPRRLILVLVLAMTLASIATGTALATRRGSTGARITFDPAQVVEGTQYQVKGTGFGANKWVSVGAYYSDTTWWASGVTDDHGRFSLTLTATRPGQVLHEAYQQGNSGRFRLKTSKTLTVDPAPAG